MKKTNFALLLAAAALALSACSYSPGSHIGIEASIYPEDGSVDQPVDVTVTVDFNDSVSAPSGWLDSFSLRLGEGAPTLCTDVVYDAEGNRATCRHDDLEPGTRYYVYLSGIVAVNGQITDFTTAQ